jgi:predicted nucleic acid-binding protein
MSVVLDSTVVIDILRGDPSALAYIDSLELAPTCSEVTRIEVIRGLRSGERRPATTLFAAIEWVAIDEAIASRAGELGRRWRRSHPGIAVADLAVAATADHIGAPLATANVRHFPMFPELEPPY